MGKNVAPATGLGSFKTLVEPSGVATGLPPRTFHLPEGPVGLPPFWLRVDSRRPVHPVRARNSYGQPCETHIPTASQKIYLCFTYTSYTLYAKCEYLLDFFEQKLSGALDGLNTLKLLKLWQRASASSKAAKNRWQEVRGLQVATVSSSSLGPSKP